MKYIMPLIKLLNLLCFGTFYAISRSTNHAEMQHQLTSLQDQMKAMLQQQAQTLEMLQTHKYSPPTAEHGVHQATSSHSETSLG